MRFPNKLKCSRTFCLLLVAFLSTSGTVTCFPNLLKHGSGKLCKSDSCQRLATGILDKMDRRIDPCDDFYGFACGRFSKSDIEFPYEYEDAVVSRHQDEIDLQLLSTIIQSSPHDSKSLKKLKSYYKTCMNKDRRTDTGADELKALLHELGWPLLVGHTWNESQFDWHTLMSNFRKTGLDHEYFISLEVSFQANRNEKIVFIDPPFVRTFGERMFSNNSQTSDESLEKMVRFAKTLGVDEKQATLELKPVLRFSRELREITRSPTGSLEENMISLPIYVLRNKYPSIRWIDYLNGILSPSIELGDEDLVLIFNPKYFENLSLLLATTPKRTLANYVFYSEARELAKYTNLLTNSSVAFTEEGKARRSVECLEEANQRLRYALNAMYMKEFFDESKKETVNKLIWQLNTTFKEQIRKSRWMDKTSADAISNKIDRLQVFVAYRDELLDERNLDHYYETLSIYNQSFLRTQLSANLLYIVQRYQKHEGIFKLFDAYDEFGHISSIDVRYFEFKNRMTVPAAFLKRIASENQSPHYINYGGAGVNIAHEMTHIFDTVGRLYDEYSNMTGLWTPNVEQAFLTNEKCISEQYSNFTVDGQNYGVDDNALEENIADNFGLKIAYLAYEKWLDNNGYDYQLPGLRSYNPKQMFWIAYAGTMCTKYSEEALKLFKRKERRTISSYRVNGPISNRPEFMADFECKADSNMNRKSKCDLW